MKLLFTIILFTSVGSSFAKNSMHEFNQKLLEQVESEIQTDDYKLRKSNIHRGPASVPENKIPVHREAPKVDKSIRQTGHSNW